MKLKLKLKMIPALGASTEGLTVSGLSSGGFMAAQMHFIYSEKFSGAGIISGGPYFCAQGSFDIAYPTCTEHPEDINLDVLNQKISKFENIDDTSNMLG